MEKLIPYLLPPVIGAVIGYVTNRIAIGMLFRPYREKRIFGIRLPFTPGIIPRQRYRLSASIGTMVSTQLFTEDAFKRQVQSPDFRERLKVHAGGFIDGFLDNPAGTALQGGILWDEFAPVLGKGVVRTLVERYWNSPFFDLFPALDTGFLVRFSGTLSSEKRPLGHYLPYHAAELLSEILDERYPELVAALDGFLRKPRIKTQLEIRGRFFLEDVFGHLSSMQRLMLMAGQYDRSLMDKMPGIVENGLVQLNRGLKEPEIRGRIVKWVKVAILSARRQPVSDLFRGISGGGIEPGGAFTSAMGEISRRLGEIHLSAAAALFGLGSPAECADAASGLFFPSGEESGGGILVKLFGSRPPGSVFRLDAGQRERLADGIAAGAASLLERNVKTVLDHIDVHSLVVQRIDSLEVEKVEDLLLVVIETHLKYINLFGALLGALIGGLQLLVR